MPMENTSFSATSDVLRKIRPICHLGGQCFLFIGLAGGCDDVCPVRVADVVRSRLVTLLKLIAARLGPQPLNAQRDQAKRDENCNAKLLNLMPATPLFRDDQDWLVKNGVHKQQLVALLIKPTTLEVCWQRPKGRGCAINQPSVWAWLVYTNPRPCHKICCQYLGAY